MSSCYIHSQDRGGKGFQILVRCLEQGEQVRRGIEVRHSAHQVVQSTLQDVGVRGGLESRPGEESRSNQETSRQALGKEQRLCSEHLHAVQHLVVERNETLEVRTNLIQVGGGK